ncbi:MAG: imidazole glycerol phosphate synthase subunit HisF [Calditrichaeota bacterium]|nr:imidazole glycerol phosphate synthase subunit HisF [Calditrichota bacterium]
MLTRRIIPCLDVQDGQTVKGVHFVNLRRVGDPVTLGQFYARQGADELVYLDITATVENRRAWVEMVQRVAQKINIPFTVGGGIRTIGDVEKMLQAGADKVSVNSAAVQEPALVNRMAREFGSQCIVIAIDARQEGGEWWVYTHGGRQRTFWRAIDWAREVTERGAGEILLTSMNHDGTRNGFALDITRQLAEMLPIPVIASGGAGRMEHFLKVFREGKADAALAASVFHFGHFTIPQLKQFLKMNGIEVRL